MAKRGGLDNGDGPVLTAETRSAGSFPDGEKQNTTDSGSSSTAGRAEKTVTIGELLSEVESCKDQGNVEFHKGRMLAKHTAGKNLLRDACIVYAEGLQALAKADARLHAEYLARQEQHGRHDDGDNDSDDDEQEQEQQQQQQEEEDPEDRDDSAVGNNNNTNRNCDVNDDNPCTPSPSGSTTLSAAALSQPLPLKGRTEKNDTSCVDDHSSGSNSSNSSDRLSISQLAALSRRADAVRPLLYLNLAACNLLLQEWAPAIACCTHVLEAFCGDTLHKAEAGTNDGVAAADGSVGRSTDGSCTATAAATVAAAGIPLPGREQQQQQQLHHHQEHEQEKRVLDGGEQGDCSSSSSCSRLIGEGAVTEVRGPKQDEEEEKRQAETSRRREIAAKCLYRRAAARVGGGDLDAAREDLVRALRLKPRDAAIGRELKKVENKLAEEEAKESLRRKTEEGRRRRQQQQQQQQRDNPRSTKKAVNATSATVNVENAITQQLAPASAPRADHAVTAGGGKGTETLGGGINPDDVHGTDAGARNAHASGDGHARSKGSQDQLQGPPQSEEDGKRGKRAGGDEEAKEPPEEAFPTWNGGECRDGLYAWNQSIREVQVCVKIPGWARSSDVRVDIRRSRVSVAVVVGRTDGDEDNVDGRGNGNGSRIRRNEEEAGGNFCAGRRLDDGLHHQEQHGHEDTTTTTTKIKQRSAPVTSVLLAGGLSRPVQVDECLWTMERAGRVLLYLQKELPADGEPGFEWWASVMEGDPEVDVTTCDAGSDASKYPEHAKRRGARALFEHLNKSPEEKLNEERMRDARRQMEEEAEERQRDLEKAMQDPKKAELYRRLREAMPDTTISIK